MQAIKIQLISWSEGAQELQSIRTEVFMREQGVSAELEWDGLDEAATHLLLRNAHNEAIGCARILHDAHIGRMAILKAWRNKGYGAAMLNAAIEFCCEHHAKTITLSAQVNAIGFYERAGFSVCSEVYLDANIPHQDMQLIC